MAYKPSPGIRKHSVKAKDAKCTVCRGLRYKIPGPRCLGCNRNRDPKFCPSCGGMPERVTGATCLECGTVAGKNIEYTQRVLASASVGSSTPAPLAKR